MPTTIPDHRQVCENNPVKVIIRQKIYDIDSTINEKEERSGMYLFLFF